jgi:hypothetical protein
VLIFCETDIFVTLILVELRDPSDPFTDIKFVAVIEFAFNTFTVAFVAVIDPILAVELNTFPIVPELETRVAVDIIPNIPELQVIFPDTKLVIDPFATFSVFAVRNDTIVFCPVPF